MRSSATPAPAGVVATAALEAVVVVLRAADLLAVARVVARLRRGAEQNLAEGVTLLLGLATLGHGGNPFGR